MTGYQIEYKNKNKPARQESENNYVSHIHQKHSDTTLEASIPAYNDTLPDEFTFASTDNTDNIIIPGTNKSRFFVQKTQQRGPEVSIASDSKPAFNGQSDVQPAKTTGPDRGAMAIIGEIFSLCGIFGLILFGLLGSYAIGVVLGIAGFLFCVIGIILCVLALKGRLTPQQRKSAKRGRIIGIIGLSIGLVLLIAGVILWFMFG